MNIYINEELCCIYKTNVSNCVIYTAKTQDAEVVDVRIEADSAIDECILNGLTGDEFFVRNIHFRNVSAHGEWITSTIKCRMIAERTSRITFEVT